MPIGTLMKNIERQPPFSRRKPPRLGPTIEPMGMMLLISPMAWARCRGYSSEIMPMTEGSKSAAADRLHGAECDQHADVWRDRAQQ